MSRLVSFTVHLYLTLLLAVAKGIVALPKSVTPARILSNLKDTVAAAEKLTPEDLKVLDGLAAAGKQKRSV